MKRILGIVLLLIGIVGFVGATEFNKIFRIDAPRYQGPGTHSLTVEELPGDRYEVKFWVVDEEMGLQEWADVEATVRVLDAAGEIAFQESLAASASSAQETGGVKRAQIGTSYEWTALADQPLTLSVELTRGDYADIEIYQNLPPGIDLLPALAIFLGIVGLILILRSRTSKA